MNSLLLPVVALLTCLSAFAIEDPKPVFSETGRKRVLSSIATLEENIRMAENNIRVSELNINTIEAELKILDAFHQEHLELKKKYEAYLSMAADAVKKHRQENGYTKLPNMPTINQPKVPKVLMGKKAEILKEDFVARTKIAAQDRDAKGKWMADAESKIARVNALMRGVAQNLREIDMHRGPLRTQLSMWRNRIGEYKNVLGSLKERKVTMDRYADKAREPVSLEVEEN